jgi:hypothetical protein
MERGWVGWAGEGWPLAVGAHSRVANQDGRGEVVISVPSGQLGWPDTIPFRWISGVASWFLVWRLATTAQFLIFTNIIGYMAQSTIEP